MKDLAASAQLSSLQISWFMPKTKARVTRIERIMKVLGRSGEKQGSHWFAQSFLQPGKEREYVLNVHIDDEQVARSTQLLTEVRYRVRPTSTPPPRLAKQKQRADWAFNELEGLVGAKAKIFCFFEAVVRVPNVTPPSPIVDLPITIHGVPLPITGIEYGSDETDRDGVTHFRWTRVTKGTRFHVSYVHEVSSGILRDAWRTERDHVLNYIEEGLAKWH